MKRWALAPGAVICSHAVTTLFFLGVALLAQPPVSSASALFSTIGRGDAAEVASRIMRDDASVVAANATMMGKITELLQEMKDKSLFLQSEAVAQHSEVTRVCENITSTYQSDAGDLEVQVEELAAGIGELDLQITELSTAIVEHGAEVNRSSEALAAARTERSESAKIAMQEVEEYTSAIVAIERALEVVEQTPSGESSVALGFLAASSARRKNRAADVATKEAMVAARRALHSTRYTPDDGGLAKDEHLFDEFADLDTAKTPYTSHATTVTGLFADLKVKFESERTALLDKESAQRSAFEGEQTSLETAIESNREAYNEKRSLLATKRVELVEKKQALSDSNLNLNSTNMYIDKVQSTCVAKELAYQEIHAMRAQEVEALTKAIEIVTGGLAAHASRVPLRLFSAAKVSSAMYTPSDATGPQVVEGERKLLGFLRVQAAKLGSDTMGRLAGSVGELLDNAGTHTEDDPLEKVRGMIRDLILQMQASATEEAGHKAWCDTELAKNEEVQKGAQADVDKHSALIQQREGQIAQLQVELEQLNDTLTKATSDRATFVTDRANESAINLATVTDAEESARLADTAIMLLQEYFSNVSKAALLIELRTQSHAQLQEQVAAEPLPDVLIRAPGASAAPLSAQGSGVVAMMEVIRDEYTSLATKTKAREAEAVELHRQVLEDHDIMVTSATGDQQYKTEELARREEELSTSQSNLNASSTEHTDALAAYENLKQPCLNTETYEERSAKREAEISALQEAYDMIEEYSAQYTGAASAASALLQRVKNDLRNDSHPEVGQVAQLLSEIKSEVLVALEGDLKVYEEMASWCTDTIALKQSAIAEAAQRERDLEAEIESHAQERGILEAQIAHSEKELGADTNSLDQLTEIRSQAAETFHKTETELLQSVQALQNALTVLSGHYEANATESRDYLAERQQLEQEKSDLNLTSPALLVAVAGEVRRALKALPGGADVGLARISSEDRDVLQEFLSSPQTLLLASRSSVRSAGAAESDYALSSGIAAKARRAEVDGDMVYGILKQLLETFKADLAEAQAAETKAISDHETLGSSKRAQVITLQATLASKREQLVHYTTAGAEANEDYTYNRAARLADTTYLQDVQLQCTEHDQEFSIRNATRREEVTALDEAIAILTAGAGVAVSSGSGAMMFVRHSSQPILAVPSGRVFRRSKLHGVQSNSSSVKQPAHRFTNTSSSVPLAHPATPPSTPSASSSSMKLVGDPKTPKAALAATTVRVRLARHVQRDPVVIPAAVSERTPAKKVLVTLATRSHVGFTGPLTVDAISNVVARIDELRSSLREESAMEVRMHDTCIRESNAAAEQLERRLTDEARHNVTLQRLDATLNSTATEVSRIRQEISALNESVNLSQVQRTEEFAEFRKSVESEEAHQAKLQQAIESLKVVYGGGALSFIMEQRRASNATTPAPAPLPERTRSRVNTTTYKAKELDTAYSKPLDKHEGSVGILAILQMLVDKSVDMVEALVRAEEGGRDGLLVDLGAARRAMEEKDRQVVALEKTYADTEVQRQETNATWAEGRVEQGEIAAFLNVIEEKCSSLLDNFASNQNARSLELENLLHAIQLLRGMVDSTA
jgi:hypothetical protein